MELEELLARVRALLRRRNPEQTEVLRFDDLELDTGSRVARRGPREFNLSTTEYELLQLFMRRPRQVLTRDIIMDRVWGYDFEGESNVLEVYVGYLRTKMEAGGEPRLLHTVRGAGYVLREPAESSGRAACISAGCGRLRQGRRSVGICSVLRALRRWALTTISVRLRLALWYGALMTLTLTLFSVAVFAVAQLQLESSVDQALQGRAQLIAHTLQGELLAASEQHQASTADGATPTASATVTPTTRPATPVPTGTPRAAPAPTVIPTPVPTADPQQTAKVQRQLLLNEPVRDLLGRLDFTFEVLNADGRPAYYAPNIASTGLPLDAPMVNGALLDGTCGAYTRSQHASLLRIYVYPVTLPAGSVARQANAICQAGDDATIVGAVVVAKTIDDVSGSLATLRQLLIVGVIIAVLCTSLGGWLIASSGLRPVTAVTRTARAIAVNAHAAGLGRRVGYTGPRDEVGELASTFDDMLAAIERVAQAQRRFVADASHELRAPLTTIKGSLEFLARAPNLPLEERSALVDDAYTEADRMATLVNDLLLLARADAAALSGTEGARLDDQMRGRRELVELDQLALDLFRHARAQLQARHKTQIHFTIDNLEPVTVLADPGQLRQVAFDPAGQRDQIHTVRRHGAHRGAPAGRARGDQRHRHGNWDRSRGSAAHLRTVLSQRQGARPRSGGERPWAGDCEVDRRDAWRRDRHGQPAGQR